MIMVGLGRRSAISLAPLLRLTACLGYRPLSSKLPKLRSYKLETDLSAPPHP